MTPEFFNTKQPPACYLGPGIISIKDKLKIHRSKLCSSSSRDRFDVELFGDQKMRMLLLHRHKLQCGMTSILATDPQNATMQKATLLLQSILLNVKGLKN